MKIHKLIMSLTLLTMVSCATNKFTFQKKMFNRLSELNIKTVIEVHNTIITDTFRDDLKFQRVDGLHAYLFMFGNNRNGYRQIRLAIYKE